MLPSNAASRGLRFTGDKAGSSVVLVGRWSLDCFHPGPVACIHPKINEVLENPFKYIQPFELNTKEKEHPSPQQRKQLLNPLEWIISNANS